MKISLSVYAYKIKIQIWGVSQELCFYLFYLSVSFSNNQQLLESFPSSMGALSTGFPFSEEIAMPTCDEEALLPFSWTSMLLSSGNRLLKLYFYPWHWEQHRQCYCLCSCSTTKFSVIRFHLEMHGPTILLKAYGICESSSCRLRFMKAPSHKKKTKPKPKNYWRKQRQRFLC